jgi:hypothetical protein
MTAVATPLHNFNHFNTRRFSVSTAVSDQRKEIVQPWKDSTLGAKSCSIKPPDQIIYNRVPFLIAWNWATLRPPSLIG